MSMTDRPALSPAARRFVLNLAWMLAATDLALVVLHLATGLDLVDLDREANLTSWYSSAKLAGVALLCLAASGRLGGGGGGRAWLAGAAGFLALSADESAALHESFTRWLLARPGLAGLRETLTGGDAMKASYAWVWVLLPLVLLGAACLAYLFWRGLRGERGSLALCFAGLGALLAAVGLEAVVLTFPPLAAWGERQIGRYEALTTVEECAELAGVTLLFAALARHLARGSASRADGAHVTGKVGV
jgi:hypothetical protein